MRLWYFRQCKSGPLDNSIQLSRRFRPGQARRRTGMLVRIACFLARGSSPSVVDPGRGKPGGNLRRRDVWYDEPQGRGDAGGKFSSADRLMTRRGPKRMRLNRFGFIVRSEQRQWPARMPIPFL
jgi:hypothetical protein